MKTNNEKQSLGAGVCVVYDSPDSAHTHTPSSRPLGIHGKLHAMPETQGLEKIARRIERFALQEIARSILREMIERNGKMTYVHQVRNCLRARITKQKGVTLFYNCLLYTSDAADE